MKKPVLYLLPNLLSDEQSILSLPQEVKTIVMSLDGLIAESEKGARKFLKRFISGDRLRAFKIELLNEHTKDLGHLISLIEKGDSWGLISDSGLTCLADPGANLIFHAKPKGIIVKTVAGPSSIITALQLSALPSQRFSFLGYLPREDAERKAMLKELEKSSLKERSTKIFIETPYRNMTMLKSILTCLKDRTYLCIAKHLFTKDEKVYTFPVSTWKKKNISLQKEPCVFLIYAAEVK